MTPKQRRELGEDLARLVVTAEHRFPGRGTGPVKRRWVEREAARRAPDGDSSSAAFGRWFGRHALRIAVEIAVAVLNEVKLEATDG